MRSWTEIMMSQILYQNDFILRTSAVANFADIIKILIMFIKTIVKNSKKVKKKLEIMYQNTIYICIY